MPPNCDRIDGTFETTGQRLMPALTASPPVQPVAHIGGSIKMVRLAWCATRE